MTMIETTAYDTNRKIDIAEWDDIDTTPVTYGLLKADLLWQRAIPGPSTESRDIEIEKEQATESEKMKRVKEAIKAQTEAKRLLDLSYRQFSYLRTQF